MPIEVREIPTDLIKFFLRRSRAQMPYSRLKESIRDIGLKTPIGVRDIRNKPKRERERRPQGGLYDYELVYGQGRLQAFRDLSLPRIPAVIVDVGEEEIVGRFLAENVMRRQMSAREKTELIRRDVEENDLEPRDIADRYHLSLSQATKYFRIIIGASARVRELTDAGELNINEADKLMQLPEGEQDIVIDVMQEHGLDKTAIYHLVDEANKLRSKGRVTRSGLSSTLDELNKQLKGARERYKLKRAEYDLGPANLYKLAEDESFRKRAVQMGIDFGPFSPEEAVQ